MSSKRTAIGASWAMAILGALAASACGVAPADDGAARSSSTGEQLSGLPTYEADTACEAEGARTSLGAIVRSAQEAQWTVGPIGNSGTEFERWSTGAGNFVSHDLTDYILAKTGYAISQEQHASGYWALMVAHESTGAALSPRVVAARRFGSCRHLVVDDARTAQYVLVVPAKAGAIASAPSFQYFADTRIDVPSKTTVVRDGADTYLLVDPPKADMIFMPGAGGAGGWGSDRFGGYVGNVVQAQP